MIAAIALSRLARQGDKERSMHDNFRLDMTMMYATHDAFRRDLTQVAHMTTRSRGWDVFARFLRAHHLAEDEALWPVMREALADQRDDLGLLDQMAAEHAALEPLLEGIERALDRRESAPTARAELATRLGEHLAHEEQAGLPLIDRTLDGGQWMRFGEAAAACIAPDMGTFLPWVLDDADAERTRTILGQLPEPARQTYLNDWQLVYATTDWWAK